MPKKPSTVVVMENYPALSSRSWHSVVPRTVRRIGRSHIEFDFAVLHEPSQDGHIITIKLPAILAPGSPLCIFLDKGFDLRLHDDQPYDLSGLVGQMIQARFSKSSDGQAQSIVAVRAYQEPIGSDLDAD